MTLRNFFSPGRLSIGLLLCASIAVQAQGFRPPAQGNGTGPMRKPAVPSALAPPITLPTPGPAVPSRQADYIVAVVNSEPVTNNEVAARLATVEQQFALQGSAVPSREQLHKDVLEQLINEKAQLQQAKEIGVVVDDAALEVAEQNLARQNRMDVAEMRRRLAEEGMSAARFRADVRSQLVRSRLRDREVESKVRVSDLDVDQFIREQQASTDMRNVEVNLGHILVLVSEGATASRVIELQAKARAAADRAKAGDDFAALARDYSDAPERANGGLLGLRLTAKLPQLFVDSTQGVRVGGVVGPIRSAAGFHVLKVVERVRAGVPGSTVTQNRARHILLRTSPQFSEAQAREQMAKYRQRLQSGQIDFPTLAAEVSQDASAKQGGDLGWANPGQFVPEFDEAMNLLQPGQISEPVVSRFGVHLIQLVERREATIDQKQQRDMARNVLREKKMDEAYLAWAQDIRGRAYVEFREPPQ